MARISPENKVRALRACLWLMTAGLCCAMFSALRSHTSQGGFEWVNHDVANTLYVGRQMIAGQRLYVDILEINLPTIFLASGAIDTIASWLHASPIHAYHGCVLLLGCYGTTLVTHYCSKAPSPRSLVLFTLAYWLVLFAGGLPGERQFLYSFGQREHLFTLLFLPYLCWRLQRYALTKSAALMLVLLGVLVSLKPHFAVLIVAVELLCRKHGLAQRRRTWFLLGTGAMLPLLALAALSGESLVALFRVMVPYHFRSFYSAFNQTYLHYVHSAPHHWLLVYAGAALYFAWPLWTTKSLTRATRSLIVILPVLAYALVVQQHKFWDYHSIIVVSLVLWLSVFTLVRLLPRLPQERRTVLFSLGLAALTLQLGFALNARLDMLREWRVGRGEYANLLKLVPVLRDRHNVLYYSTSIAHMRLALSLHQRISGKRCHELTYPALVREPDPARRQSALHDYCDEQQRLIESARPDAVVFVETHQGLQTSEQEPYNVLVTRCHVIPPATYSESSTNGLSNARVFLRNL